ncbi:MAG: hypothetical protein WBA51_18105 [Erythrobacter sp.]
MIIESWQPPTIGDLPSPEEQWLAFDAARKHRVLVLPALFDEANKMRRFTLEVMRRLDENGVDTALPDMPGCNESLAALDDQTLKSWRQAAQAAASRFSATHCLTIRAGDLIGPPDLPGWSYAPATGSKTLREMLRARVLAGREGGMHETREELLERGRANGLVLAGWPLGAQMIRDLEAAEMISPGPRTAIDQAQLGGAGLWLRAEPDDNAEQTETLAQLVLADLDPGEDSAK